MEKLRPYIVKFLQLTRLNKIVQKIYYNYFHGFQTATKQLLPAIERCLEKSQQLGTSNKGDYYEFGIFKGYAFWHAQNTANRIGLLNTRFFGFDSFEGLPEVTEEKKKDFYKGQYACSYDSVVKNLDAQGVDWKRTTLVKGFFDQSLTLKIRAKHKMGKIAVGLIDCDIYHSTRDVLKFIEPMILDKTILMFDDWNCYNKDNSKGQRRALAEFLKKNKQWQPKEYFSYGNWGQVFVMHKKKN